MPSLADHRLRKLDRAAQDFGQIHDFTAQLEQPAVYTRGLEQIIHQPHQVRDLALPADD